MQQDTSPSTPFDSALAERETGLAEFGFTPWMDVARIMHEDGSVTITALRNATTGEVRSR